MPMIDACIPEGALTPEAEAKLFEELTNILIRLEGLDPANERARAASWIFVHRPRVYVAGAAAATPRYRFIPVVPEGQYDDARRAAVVREVTEAVSRAEGRPLDEVGTRVWVFPTELPDGHWGSRGQLWRLPDIAARLAGEDGRRAAQDRLSERRRQAAVALLGAVSAAPFDSAADAADAP